MLYGHTLNLPPERYDAATFAFQVALITFVISVLQVPYNAVIIADEKMGVFAKISIIEAFLKLALTFIISYIIADKLKLYSLLMLLNSFIILFIYRTYCKKRITYTKYKFVWDPLLFKRILSFTGWNMLGALAGVLSESGVSLIFNNFCGVIINASIGLSNQVNNALSNFTT